MDITFDRGSQETPKGHALLYFRNSSDPEEIWATYLVVLPVSVDVSKYVPPFLMNQVGELGPKDLSAFAFPPAPEKIASFEYLQELAIARDDDVIFGGTMDPADVASALMSVNEIVQRYSEVYSQTSTGHSLPEPNAEAAGSGLGVNEVLYGLMSDADKLSELTKLVGKIRYAAEGSEDALVQEAEDDIHLLAQHMPENHQVPQLIEAAKAGGSRGTKLAELYLQRCFCLLREEYAKLVLVEDQIKAVEAGDSSA
jgi:hypothetical protein